MTDILVMARYASAMNLRRPMRVVTPTLDGDVLGVLAAGEVALSGREISRRAGASQEGVRAALDRLVRQGIVEVEAFKQLHLFRLNRQHLAARWVEGLSQLRLELIDRLRGAISLWKPPPITATLFGSVARGDADEDSDIDILLVRPVRTMGDGEPWRSQVSELQRSTTAWSGNDARVLEYSSTEFAKLRTREPTLRTALSEGVDLLKRST